jgi:predicted nucleic acid-binding protein
MSGVVSNATPLIYLAKAGRIVLLRRVFREVYIPEEVKVEVVDKGKRLGEKDAYVVEKAIEDGWIKVLNVEAVETSIRLESGEVAVLSLAKKLGREEVLMDEISARTAARLMGLKPRGTIYVLLKALQIREISMNMFLDALSDLVKHGSRLREEVYLEALRKAREIVEKSGC